MKRKFLLLLFFMVIGFFGKAQKPVPYLQTPTSHSIWITWRTEESLQSKVMYGESKEMLTNIIEGSTQTLTDPKDNYTKNYHYHSVQLVNLEPNTHYYYKVISEELESEVYSFKTQPLEGSHGIYRFLILGDHQLFDDRYERLVKAAKTTCENKYQAPIEESINLLTNIGDQVDVGTLKHYELVHFKPSEPISPNIPIMTIVGNHETYGTLGLGAYNSHFFYDSISYKGIKSSSEYYYAMQQGRALFLMLSSEHTNNTQLMWAQQVIETAKNDPEIDWIFSYNHRPIQAEQYVGDISVWVRDKILPLLNTTEKSVLNVGAHHHLYHRGQLRDYPTYHIINGGASWDQRWGQSTEKDFDDVQKTIDYWPFQIVELNSLERTMYVETYVIGNQEETLDSITLVDTFFRKFGANKPNKPSIQALEKDTLELPYTFISSAYSSDNGYEYNSVQFQIAASEDFLNPEFDLIRDYENIYGAHPPKCQLVDIYKGVDIFSIELGKEKLYDGKHFIRVRHRDRNIEWSEWSDPVPFVSVGGLAGEPSLASQKNTYSIDEDIPLSFANATDLTGQWMGIYKEGKTPGANSPSEKWQNIAGESGVVNFQMNKPGVYYAVLFKDSGYEILAKSSTFYVGTIPVLSTDKLKYNEGDPIKISYQNAPKLAGDWIGIYKTGQAPGGPTSTSWDYLTAAINDTLTLQSPNLKKGYYFATYLMQERYFEPGERVYIQIGEHISGLTLTKNVFKKSEPIVFYFDNGPGTPKDYIGIYKQGDVYGVDELTTYLYVDGRTSGDLKWEQQLEAGNYYGYLFTNDSYEAVSNIVEFTVLPENTSSEIGKLAVQINQASDDQEEWLASNTENGETCTNEIGGIDYNSTDLELGFEDTDKKNPQMVGLRFNNINLDKNAVIVNSYLTFEVDATSKNTDPCNLIIYAEDTDNASTFNATSNYTPFELTSRPKITDSILWDVPADSLAIVDQKYNSVDIAPLIQKIVDRSGWEKGNSLALYIKGTGTREVEAYEGEPSAAAILNIEYYLSTEDSIRKHYTDSIINVAESKAEKDYTVPSYTELQKNIVAAKVNTDSLTIESLKIAIENLQDKNMPYSIVMNIYQDPSTKMAFNWFTNEDITGGKVEIVEGIAENHEQFATPLKAIQAQNIPVTELNYNVSRNNLNSIAGIPDNTKKSYTENKALAENLTPNTTYSFRVGMEGAWSDIGTFTTGHHSDQSFSFVYTTDPQANTYEMFDISQRTTHAAQQAHPDANFWLHCGDLVESAGNLNSEWEWEQLFLTQQDIFLQKPFAPVGGNHDKSANQNFAKHFFTDSVSFDRTMAVSPGSVYSYIYGDALFMALSFEDYSTTDYLDSLAGWMIDEVNKYPDTKWRFVYYHKALFTGSKSHQSDNDAKTVREKIAPIFDSLKIDIAFQGHDHIYEVIGPVKSKQLVEGAVSGREIVAVDSRENVTGKLGGVYNTDNGTLYFLNNSAGKKKYEPRSKEEMDAAESSLGIANYFNLFTGRFGQTGRPTFSNITVSHDTVVLTTYEVFENDSIELFDEFKVTKSQKQIDKDYWVNEDFSDSKWIPALSGKYSSDEQVANTLAPESLEVITFRTDAESTEENTPCPGTCLRSKDAVGYIEFTTPDAGVATFHIKAKSSSGDRIAKISINGEQVGILQGLDQNNCKVFAEEIHSDSPVTFKIEGISGGPVMIAELVVTKYSENADTTKAPSIKLASSSTPYLGTNIISGVIDDPTCPAANIGLDFEISGYNPDNISVIVTSNNQEVVSDDNLQLQKSENVYNLRVIPSGVGYATLTITATEGEKSRNYSLHYGASQASQNPDNTFWHTGISDASTAIKLDSTYMLVADDETNSIRLINGKQSGLPVNAFDFSSDINVSEECDIEASAKGALFPNRIYWTGSLGNSKSGNSKPARNRIFSTDMQGEANSVKLTYANHYEKLREKIITWGDDQGWDFTHSASVEKGMIPKRIDGFNLEGMEITSEGNALLGFRAPLVPEKGITPDDENRKYALIISINNFEQAMQDGVMDDAEIGNPILLDLNGRSIRGIHKLSNGEYIIITGMYDDSSNPAIYWWEGIEESNPIQLSCELLTEGEAHPEGMMELSMSDSSIQLQLISDNGTIDFYNDGKEAKSLADGHKKFRSDIVTLTLPVSEPCDTVSNISISNITKQSADISWTAPENQIKWEIEYSIIDSTEKTKITIEENPTITLQELMGETTYELRIRPLCQNDSTLWSSKTRFTTEKTVGFQHIGKNEAVITLSPNPTTGLANLGLHGINEEVEINIITLTGKVIFSQNYHCKTSTNINIDLSDYPKGVYIIQISSRKNQYLEKLIVH